MSTTGTTKEEYLGDDDSGEGGERGVYIKSSEKRKDENLKNPKSSYEDSPYLRKKKDKDKEEPKVQPLSLSPRRKPSTTTTIVKTKKTATTSPREKKAKQQQLKRKKETRDYSNFFPEDVLEHIFSYLEGSDLIAVCMVSVGWRTVAEREELWMGLFTKKGWKLPSERKKGQIVEDESDDSSQRLPVPITYKNYYLKTHQIHIDDWQQNSEENTPATKLKIMDRLKKKKEVKLLLLGLDGAGKTVALYQLFMDKPIDSIPTLGTIEEQIKYQKMTFNLIEIGGHKMMQQLLDQFLPTADVIMWVVDANDKQKIEESKTTLHRVDQTLYQFSRPALLAVLVSKIDVPGALGSRAVISEMDLENLHFRAIYVQSVRSSTSSKELWIVIDWIYTHLYKLKKKKS